MLILNHLMHPSNTNFVFEGCIKWFRFLLGLGLGIGIYRYLAQQT